MRQEGLVLGVPQIHTYIWKDILNLKEDVAVLMKVTLQLLKHGTTKLILDLMKELKAWLVIELDPPIR